MTYDFCGYATRSNVKCSDGRTIMPGAFRDDDGKTVPLVWNHQHGQVGSVLGHALLENRKDGVYVYATFNDTPEGQRGKELVRHGDITALSIFANKLKEQSGRVMHGIIREVSLVLAGANPEATIDSFVAHSDGSFSDDRSQGWFYSGLNGEIWHSESDTDDDEDEKKKKPADEEDDSDEDAEAPEDTATERDEEDKSEEDAEDEPEAEADGDEADDSEDEERAKRMALVRRHREALAHADEKESEEDDEQIGDILDSFTDKQKAVVVAMMENVLAQAAKDGGDTSEEDEETQEDGKLKHSMDYEEDTDMKKNLFDQENMEENVLSHADEMKIMELAKSKTIGTLKGGMQAFCENTELAHGFDTQSLTLLFPEYKDLKPGGPELLTDDQGWITKVLNKVHKSLLTHIRVKFTDVRDIENLRAKGYKEKGTKKTLTGDVSVLYRTTDPQTVYVRSSLHRDDVLDIQDFDYVAYMYNIDKMTMNEELATAILLGDGRDIGDQYKIKEDKIIPVWKDHELFTIHRTVDFATMRQTLQGTNTNMYFGDNFVYAETFVQELLYGREEAKNVGMGDLFIAPHVLNTMLLARDRNGRRIYNTVEELRSALNVNSIITVEQMEGKIRTFEEQGVTKNKKLLAILVDLKNYHVGTAKGGELTHFTDFDINFNTLESLLETRTSGMNTRPFSALVLEEDVNAGTSDNTDPEDPENP